MSIFKNRKRVNPYSQIDNAMINDGRLSLECIGLLTYLLSKPEDWTISMQQVQSHFKIGREKLQRIVKDLEQTGYLIRMKPQNEQGQFIGTSWYVTDEPTNGFSAAADHRLTGFPTVGKPVSQYTNKEYNKYREDTPSLQAQPISPVPKSETPSEQQTKATSVIQSVIPSVVSSVATSEFSSDLKEESAAGQRTGAAVSGAADSSAYHSQREAYRTDSELRTIMAAYYKGNPNEYTVGILNDAKGSRMTTDQLKDCMTMWASYMIENQKFNHSAHQLHQSFKRWVLRESEYKRTAQAGAKQGQLAQAETVTLKTKGFNFQ